MPDPIDNMDAFNEYASRIFDFLYDEFPKASEVHLSRFLEDPEDRNRRDVFIGTMRFLKREGFLTYERMTAGTNGYAMVVLTAKGLAVLDAVPESIQGNQSFIKRIRTALRAGTGEAAKATIQGLISFSVSSL